MVARFIEEVTDLKPDVVLFLSGGNEFAATLGGQPGDDVHWTMGVRKRVESPIMSLLDRALNQSPRPSNPDRNRYFPKLAIHSEVG